MRPLLAVAGDGSVHRMRDVVETLADEFSLTHDERKKLLPSGKQSVFNNRANWAKTYLKQAGLLQFPRRGYFQITEPGLRVLGSGKDINNEFLMQFQDFRDFKNRKAPNRDPAQTPQPNDSEGSPEDQMASAYERLRQETQKELLSTIKAGSPAFFEQLVVDLLVAMGYGGNRQDAARAIGQSGDEGVDGTIDEDRLGLDVIYIQAKRWDKTVTRPEVQKFAGALQGKRAKKGVMITTSNFSTGAIGFADSIDTRLILIDGERLTSLMMEFDVGVSVEGSYEIKRIDSDYFDE